jgi:N-hydroxyarylamine O-acetyltransferase
VNEREALLAEASDDWSVGQLDVDAYLRRTGYSGPTEPTEASLAALYRAHLRAVRFENLDVFLRGGVAVDLESVQDKIVFRGRGGYCYEHAQLFGAVLERLGFGVERLLARVGPDGGPARPRTHLTLRVRAGDGAWLADPGFGSSPPAPLRLPGDGPGGPREVDGWTYEIAPGTEHGQAVWKLRENQAGTWVTLHRWDYGKVQPVDVVMSNHYTSTHPDSWFTWQPVIVRRDPGAIRSVLGRTYTVTSAGYAKTRRELSDREFADALTGEFALRLTDDEVDVLVKAPTGRDKQPVAGVAPGTRGHRGSQLASQPGSLRTGR